MAEALTDQEIVNWVIACRNESEEGRRLKADIAELAWKQYFNDSDFSRKADWQTKASVPLWAMGVDQLAGSVQAAMTQAARLFSIEVLSPKDPVEIARANFIHDLMHLLLHEARFPRVIGEAARVGIITNLMAFKARVEDRKTRHLAPEFEEAQITAEDGTTRLDKRLRTRPVRSSHMVLDIPVLNPRHLYLDPTGKNLYKIHQAMRDAAFLHDPGIKASWHAAAVKAAFDEGASANWEEEEGERLDMQVQFAGNPMRKQVRITEFWGPVYDTQGRKRREESWIVVLNERHLAFMDDYPFWHGGDPFVVSNLIHLPFTPYGKLLFQHVGPLGSLLTELVCMVADAEKFSVLGATAVDTNQIEDMDMILGGLFPGMCIPASGNSPIQQLKFTGASPGAHNFLDRLKQMFENGMATTEFLSGAPSTRGRATAKEVETKSSLASSFVEGMTSAVQFDGLEPLVEKCYWNTIQFLNDWSDPRLQALAEKHGLSPEMLGSDPVQRYQMLRGAFRFHVSALTAVLRKAEMQEKLLHILEIVGQRPEFMQMLGPEKLHGLFDKILEVFSFNEMITQSNAMPGVVLPGGIMGQDAPQVPGTQFALPPGNQPNLGAALKARG